MVHPLLKDMICPEKDEKICEEVHVPDNNVCYTNNDGEPHGLCCVVDTASTLKPYCFCRKGFSDETGDCKYRKTAALTYASRGLDANSLILAVFLGVVAILLVSLLAFILIRLTRGKRRILGLLVEEAETVELTDSGESSESNSTDDLTEGQEETTVRAEMLVKDETIMEKPKLLIRSRRGRPGQARGRYYSSRRNRCFSANASAARSLRKTQRANQQYLSEYWTYSLHQLQIQQQQQLQQLLQLQQQSNGHLNQQLSNNDNFEASINEVTSPGFITSLPTYQSMCDASEAVGMATQLSVMSAPAIATSRSPNDDPASIAQTQL